MRPVAGSCTESKCNSWPAWCGFHCAHHSAVRHERTAGNLQRETITHGCTQGHHAGRAAGAMDDIRAHKAKRESRQLHHSTSQRKKPGSDSSPDVFDRDHDQIFFAGPRGLQLESIREVPSCRIVVAVRVPEWRMLGKCALQPRENRQRQRIWSYANAGWLCRGAQVLRPRDAVALADDVRQTPGRKPKAETSRREELLGLHLPRSTSLLQEEQDETGPCGAGLFGAQSEACWRRGGQGLADEATNARNVPLVRGRQPPPLRCVQERRCTQSWRGPRHARQKPKREPLQAAALSEASTNCLSSL